MNSKMKSLMDFRKEMKTILPLYFRKNLEQIDTHATPSPTKRK